MHIIGFNVPYSQVHQDLVWTSMDRSYLKTFKTTLVRISVNFIQCLTYTYTCHLHQNQIIIQNNLVIYNFIKIFKKPVEKY